MANIVEVVQKYVRPYYKYILIVTVLVIFIIIGALYIQNRNKQEKKSKYNDVANDGRRNKEATLMFFYADWCPHCKSAKPEWDNFDAQNDDRAINGYKVNCVKVNCTKEDDTEVKNKMDKYNIESFPTVKMLKDNQIIEFDSKITSTALESFVNIMLTD